MYKNDLLLITCLISIGKSFEKYLFTFSYLQFDLSKYKL